MECSFDEPFVDGLAEEFDVEGEFRDVIKLGEHIDGGAGVIERIGKFEVSVDASSKTATVSGPNHTANFDLVSLQSRLRFVRGLSKRPKHGHNYVESVKAHERALQLLEACL